MSGVSAWNREQDGRVAYFSAVLGTLLIICGEERKAERWNISIMSKRGGRPMRRQKAYTLA